MKKRVLAVILVLLLCLALPISAGADVIFEPQDDFYQTHRNSCTYCNRTYTAVGPNGTVTVYESPESDEVMHTFQNGESVFIHYIYTDQQNISWGYYENWATEIMGWIPMDYLEVVYDGISFEEEFGHVFLDETGTLSEEYNNQTIWFSQYPGSQSYLSMVAMDWLPEYDAVYVDPTGARWGRITYYYGLRDAWMLLDDPTTEYIPPVAEEPTEQETTGEQEEITSPTYYVEITPDGKDQTGMMIGVAAAILAVIVITLLLLKKLKRKQ